MHTMCRTQCFVGPHHFVYILRYVSWLSKMPHFGGCAPQRGAMTPKFEVSRDFVRCIYPPNFIILCLLVRKLSCWPTNKQTPPETPSVFAMLQRWVITFCDIDYNMSLILAGLDTPYSCRTRDHILQRFYKQYVAHSSSCLNYLLPEQRDFVNKLHCTNKDELLLARTERYCNSCIQYCVSIFRQ